MHKIEQTYYNEISNQNICSKVSCTLINDAQNLEDYKAKIKFFQKAHQENIKLLQDIQNKLDQEIAKLKFNKQKIQQIIKVIGFLKSQNDSLSCKNIISLLEDAEDANIPEEKLLLIIKEHFNDKELCKSQELIQKNMQQILNDNFNNLNILK
ncbi:hypothetical protein IOLA_305 [uncultured bacterium]|nr:hypothetical protein IOLA_305 [uncultured bacterium]